MTSPDTTPPVYMPNVMRMRCRKAAFHAERLYPGPVGRVLREELWAWEQFGFRFGGGSTIAALVDHILAGIGEAA